MELLRSDVRAQKVAILTEVMEFTTEEDTAFWPIADLAHLIKSRQVTSVELTRMCLDRLHRYNPLLNFVVTFTDDLALQQAQQADREIASGKYRGPLHGIPWGCKDIIAVPGYPTQWGSGAYKGQVIDTEATVVRLLRDAASWPLAINGSAAAPITRGILKMDRADRRQGRPAQPPPAAWRSASAPRPADRF